MKQQNFLRLALHSFLAILCFFTICIAGVQWLNLNPFELANLPFGIPYAIAVFAILSAHEFGHYFAARYHNINTTLPFYIPAPSFLFSPFGTMGAVIRIREPLTKRQVLYDIGIAGPLSGLVVTFVVLWVGFITLPDKTYLYHIHPEYAKTGVIPEGSLTFGYSIFFKFLLTLYHGHGFMPPMNEIYHYPFLCAGWFGLFITALNLLPIGQLDGGHILYALIGTHQRIASRVFLGSLFLFALSGLIPHIPWYHEPAMIGWLIWSAILYFIIKVDHPVVSDDTPLDPNRRLLGWITMIFFLFIFTPLPFTGLVE